MRSLLKLKDTSVPQPVCWSKCSYAEDVHRAPEERLLIRVLTALMYIAGIIAIILMVVVLVYGAFHIMLHIKKI